MRELLASQKLLWDRQHASRGQRHEGSDALRFTPNPTAVIFHELLPQSAKVLEIGCANGRDARYWASQGHDVTAIDFSHTALTQMHETAREQGVAHKIQPIMWDIQEGYLPLSGEEHFDGFYARSALHVDDETMTTLAAHINKLLKPDGIILIEGKGPNDTKIKRSRRLQGSIAVDEEENNHLRRVWTCESLIELCAQNNWRIHQVQEIEEVWEGTSASFVRLIAKKGI